MNLRGQHGYAMVALIVGMSVAAVLMSAVMPVWTQMARREKEAELIFRGEQYARAIALFQRRAGPGVLPPSIDVLVEQRFLRKKYKDPITGEDFAVLSPSTPAPGQALQGGRGGGGATPPTQGTVGAAGAQGGRGAGGVMGVVSKSPAESLRVYNGRTHYNEWQFVYVAQTQTPGAIGPGGARGRGQPGPPQGGGGGRGLGPGGQEGPRSNMPRPPMSDSGRGR